MLAARPSASRAREPTEPTRTASRPRPRRPRPGPQRGRQCSELRTRPRRRRDRLRHARAAEGSHGRCSARHRPAFSTTRTCRCWSCRTAPAGWTDPRCSPTTARSPSTRAIAVTGDLLAGRRTVIGHAWHSQYRRGLTATALARGPVDEVREIVRLLDQSLEQAANDTTSDGGGPGASRRPRCHRRDARVQCRRRGGPSPRPRERTTRP